MPQSPNSMEEQRLLDGLKQAVDLVDNQDLSPTDALVKVARDFQFTPGQLRSLTNAFNNGRQVAQWQSNTSVLDKMADFPLADYDQAYATVWGKSEKTASVHPEYVHRPDWLKDRAKEQLRRRELPGTEKMAADQEPDPIVEQYRSELRGRKAWAEQRRIKQAYDEARRVHTQAMDELRFRLRVLENYLQKSALDRLPFEIVDDAVQAYYGASGKALMDLMAGSFPREKRAADAPPKYKEPIDQNKPPFNYAAQAIEAALNVDSTKTAMDLAEQKIKKAEETLRPFAQSPSAKNSSGIPSICLVEKEAGFYDTVSDKTKGLLDRILGGKARQDDIESEWLDLEDPDHENKLRAIRAQAMLGEMLTNPESTISGHDPEQVFQAYNEIAQVAPRAADKPAIIQPLLAKRLAGNIEPFEAREMVDTEKALKETQNLTTPNTRLLADAPTELYG